jgi:tetratricopeptide (TPR) repeat protein
MRRQHAWYSALADRHAPAIEHYRKALAEFRGVLPARHHIIALTEAQLAFSLFETGEREPAENLSKVALETAESLGTAAPDQIAHIRFVRGHILQRTGRSAEAAPLLERAWVSYYRQATHEFRWRRVFMEDVIAAHEALGNDNARALWARRAREEATDRAP